MMNNIAVMLRGHVRTWKYIHPIVFKFFESISKNVDYYMVTWDNTNVDGIEDTFSGRNLIKFIILPTKDTPYYNGWYGPAWFMHHLIPYKRIREKDVKYDAVFDTRPDVVPCLRENLSPLKPENNCLYTTGFERHLNNQTNKFDLALSDWFMMMTSETYDIMSTRYKDNNNLGAQIQLRMFAEENNLNVCFLDWIDAFITRPPVFLLDWKSDYSYEKIRQSTETWFNLSTEEKIKLCKDYHISLSDYMTGTVNSIPNEN